MKAASACRVWFSAILTLQLAGCGTNLNETLTDNVTGGLHVPSRMTFPLVADAMQMHCGTLDCHGQVGRNMRLYGFRGMRANGDANSLDGDTTDGEYDFSYRSVISIEPELMSRVVDDKASHPEWLTMIRKSRGSEEHKGGQLMAVGDALDRCLVGWLAAVDGTAACDTVVKTMRPYPP